MMAEKIILDACCGGRMFWFDKQDERVMFQDKRNEIRIVDVGTPATKGRAPKITRPDVLASFTNMPYPDDTFWHVVFDPPHFHKGAGKNSVIAKTYGLLSETWRKDIRKGFSECFRVLKPNGTLIFKWCEVEIPLADVLCLAPFPPLYGHQSGKKALTHWVAFTKPNTACSGLADTFPLFASLAQPANR
jgi:SAM-dependent methyltransferase